MRHGITLTIEASYAGETFPEALAAGLTEEIRAHLAAYGLREIVIDLRLAVMGPLKP